MLVSMALIAFGSRADEGYKGLESGGSGLQFSLRGLGFLAEPYPGLLGPIRILQVRGVRDYAS